MTGLDTTPSLGFDPSPRLKFYRLNPVEEYDGLPYANACANILNVPVLSDYDLFVEFLQLSISVVFLQMHKLMSPMNVMQVTF